MSVEKYFKNEYNDEWNVCLVVENSNDKPVDVELDEKSTYITKNGDQVKQYGHDYNHYYGRFTINSNARVKAIKTFKIERIQNGDCLIMIIKLPEFNYTSYLCFKLDNEVWNMIEDNNKNVMSESLQSEIMEKRIERLESIEEALGISIENVSIVIRKRDDRTDMDLYFEIHSINGFNIKKSFDMYCVLYDLRGKIGCQHHERIESNCFYAIKLLQYSFYTTENDWSNDTSKIRLYPQL